MSEAVQRWLIYVVVFVVIWGGLLLIRPSHPYHVRGIALPVVSTAPTPTQADNVVLYRDMPDTAKRLAWVNIELHYDIIKDDDQDRVIAYTKALAAQRGGNAVVVKRFFRSPPGPLAIYLLQGLIINY